MRTERQKLEREAQLSRALIQWKERAKQPLKNIMRDHPQALDGYRYEQLGACPISCEIYATEGDTA